MAHKSSREADATLGGLLADLDTIRDVCRRNPRRPKGKPGPAIGSQYQAGKPGPDVGAQDQNAGNPDCRCGRPQCKSCNDRWDRVFAKFVDPDYYGFRPGTPSSSLAGLAQPITSFVVPTPHRHRYVSSPKNPPKAA